MGISKVYRGYVIEDVNGQWYIRNAPNYLNGFPFSPGPHGGWTVATHQVDKLHDYLNRSNSNSGNNARWNPQQPGGYVDDSGNDVSGWYLLLLWGIFIGSLILQGW